MKTPERCIVQLMRRISECKEFPHEIGLFLGYPPEDVCGFIEGKSKTVNSAVAGRFMEMQKKRKKYLQNIKKCTNAYYKQYTKGKSVERLTVAG